MDKRFYQRTKINLESGFYVTSDEPGSQSFSGVIVDISESGVKIQVDADNMNEAAQNLQVGTILTFQTLDEYELLREMREDVITGEVEVLRILKAEDGLIIGCKMVRLLPELEQYIMNKQLSIYYKNSIKHNL